MSELSPPPVRPETPNSTSGLAGLTMLASALIIVTALSIARDVLIPITLAVLLSFLLAPLVSVLRRLWLGRVPAVILAVLLALCVILGAGGLIGAQVAGLAVNIPRYATTIQQKLHVVQGATIGRLSEFVDRMASQIAHSSRQSAPGGLPIPSETGTGGPREPPNNPTAKPMPVEVHQPEPSPSDLAQRFLAPILSPLATTGIVVVVGIFILLQQEDLRDRLIRLLGRGDLHRTMTAMDEAGHRLSRYFLTLLALNTAFGCVIGLGLYFIGVPSPVLWGIVALLMRFVPYIGSWLSALFPLALAAAVDQGWSMVLWTAALFVISELVMGQVIEPLAYGRSTGLSPLTVVLAAIFWGWLWGPVGLILSMPLTLCLVIFGRHVDKLKFLDVLLGDRPPLTPVEGFYHRLLAGHLDEVQDDAEQLLKSCSLASYYDNVAIPGLRLATMDLGRGVLTEAQNTRVISGLAALLDELSEHEDVDPLPEPEGVEPAGLTPDQPRRLEPAKSFQSEVGVPNGLPDAWREPSAVLCVAGRGPLDAVASKMLAQLLGRRGLGARVIAHAEVGTRATVSALDMAGVQMVCLTNVDMSDTSSHLRYTVRRLRSRNSRTVILVGLWPSDVADDDRRRTVIDADIYAISLRETVACCLRQARCSDGSAVACVVDHL